MGFEQYKKLFNKQNKLLLKEAKKPNPRVANKFNEMIKSGARAEKIFYDPRNIKWMKATRVKQVLPTVGRTLGAASGWGTLIAGVSLLAQTKPGIGKTFQGQQRYWIDQWYKIKSGARKHPHKSLFSRVLGGVGPNYLAVNPATGQRAYTFKKGLREGRKLITSPPGTKPQNIKHFPAQRKVRN
tara:strand:+ start:39 stop:590 length:552 start_codon:yes stop_codon:yes gene_type:complete